MALSIRASVPTATANATTIVINKPTSTAAGDILLAWITCGNSGTTVSLAGWTVLEYYNGFIPSDQADVVLYRVVDGTEGSSFTFSLSGTDQTAGIITCITDSSGALTASNIDKHTHSSSTGSTTMVSATLTPTFANSLVLTSFGCDQSAGTAPNIGAPDSASSGNTLTIQADVIDTVQFVYVAVTSEIQTTATATAHSVTYVGGGNSTRGGVELSVIISPFGSISAFAQSFTQSFTLPPPAPFPPHAFNVTPNFINQPQYFAPITIRNILPPPPLKPLLTNVIPNFINQPPVVIFSGITVGQIIPPPLPKPLLTNVIPNFINQPPVIIYVPTTITRLIPPAAFRSLTTLGYVVVVTPPATGNKYIWPTASFINQSTLYPTLNPDQPTDAGT
jgi:hypothetical protein